TFALDRLQCELEIFLPRCQCGERYLLANIDEDFPALDALQFENALFHPGIIFQFLLHVIFIVSIHDQHPASLIDQGSAHQNKTVGDELIDECCVLVPKRLLSRAFRPITLRAGGRNCDERIFHPRTRSRCTDYAKLKLARAPTRSPLPTAALPSVSLIPISSIATEQTRWRVVLPMSAHAADQNSGLRRIILVLFTLGVVSMLSLIVAGAMSLISFAERIHPLAGALVFWGICLAAGFFALYCAIAYARLPPALAPPNETSGPKHEAYLQALRSRLANNPRPRELPLGTSAEIEAAIAHLSQEADLVVRRTASTVFLSTALMQNGRLDGLIVLFTQIQMVGRIARIYLQRPSPREMWRLYEYGGCTAFVASGLESLDLGEMVAPLAVSVVPALKSGIPGLSGISALLVKCVSNGAANAFLTLRVGEVARRYCELT